MKKRNFGIYCQRYMTTLNNRLTEKESLYQLEHLGLFEQHCFKVVKKDKAEVVPIKETGEEKIRVIK